MIAHLTGKIKCKSTRISHFFSKISDFLLIQNKHLNYYSFSSFSFFNSSFSSSLSKSTLFALTLIAVHATAAAQSSDATEGEMFRIKILAPLFFFLLIVGDSLTQSVLHLFPCFIFIYYCIISIIIIKRIIIRHMH